MVGEPGHGVDDGRRRFRRRNHLEQAQVARRIEEMRSEPVLSKVVAAALGKRADWNTGRVRADDRSRAPRRVDLLQQVALDVEPLDDRFENPVDVAKPPESILEPGRGYELPCVWCEEGVRFQRPGPLKALSCRLGRDVEQKCRDSRVGEVRGNLGAHDASTQHRNETDHRISLTRAPRVALRDSK
jgi:hypothetical protein